MQHTAPPLPPEPEPVGDPVARVAPALRILLAEDNAINQKVVAGMLASGGHQVVVVDNGQQAVEAVQRQVFDVVLMDIQMPEMNGLEATAAIRERRTRQGAGACPIIAMTAHAMTGDRERCLAAGMDGYVAKPIRIADMFATIAAVVAGEAPPEEGAGVHRRRAEAARPRLCRQRGAAGRRHRRIRHRDAAWRWRRCARRWRRATWPTLARAAHKMKGTVGVFTTGPALAAAGELETAAEASDVARAREALVTFEKGIGELGEKLREMRART